MTAITLTEVAIGSGTSAELPPISLALAPGAPAVIAVETDERPMLLSMLIGGRMRPTAGTIATDSGSLRTHVALVDTPFVAEPVPSLSVRAVVREELAFAGASTSRKSVSGALAASGVDHWAETPFRVLPTVDRIRLLVDLALRRPEVDTIVLTSPERHGGEPAQWFRDLSARDTPDRRLSIAIVTDAPMRDILISLGARDASGDAPTDPAPLDTIESR